MRKLWLSVVRYAHLFRLLIGFLLPARGWLRAIETLFRICGLLIRAADYLIPLDLSFAVAPGIYLSSAGRTRKTPASELKNQFAGLLILPCRFSAFFPGNRLPGCAVGRMFGLFRGGRGYVC